MSVINGMYPPSSYNILPDGSVDVKGFVGFILDHIPVKFNKITGRLYVSNSTFKTLENFPNEVTGQVFINHIYFTPEDRRKVCKSNKIYKYK
jgi:hypothetical protein